MNERTRFFIKNISLTLYSRKGWCWLCVKDELETGTDCHILTQVLLTIASLLSACWLGCSTVGHWGPKPSVWSWFSLRWHSIFNSTPTVWALGISYSLVHLLPLFFRLFTQVHLLIDGSVKGQYVTDSVIKKIWKQKSYKLRRNTSWSIDIWKIRKLNDILLRLRKVMYK